MFEPHYKQFQQDIYSQNGEDGVLDTIFKELGVDVPICCEYGGHDGIHASNSRRFLIERQSKVLYIEGDKGLFDVLKTNTKDYPTAILENCFVACENGTPLNQLLTKHSFPIDFDLLSVDIDGCDHWSLSQIGNYRPKVIVIEIDSGKHPLIPSTINLNDGAYNFASSMFFLNQMGYDVVLHTGNMIAVRKDLTHKLSIPHEQINSKVLFNTRWIRSYE
jgi:hypothetical protein